MKLYWVSWYQPVDTIDPVTYPPNTGIIGSWITGYSDEYAVLCALVHAENEEKAKAAVILDWPEAGEWRPWRFIDEKPWSFDLGTRFPFHDWEEERIGQLRSLHRHRN